MDRQIVADLVQEGSKIISRLIQAYAVRKPIASVPSIQKPALDKNRVESRGVSTEETINYQRRELAKELVLLEGHLQQGCKINATACDCCEKHPLKIEGLAQEAAGMTTDPVYGKLVQWTKEITPIITEEAAASGKYNDMYPELAMQAREFRKSIMPAEVIKEVSDESEQPTTEG